MHIIFSTLCDMVKMKEHNETPELKRKIRIADIAITIWIINFSLFISYLHLKGVIV